MPRITDLIYKQVKDKKQRCSCFECIRLSDCFLIKRFLKLKKNRRIKDCSCEKWRPKKDC